MNMFAFPNLKILSRMRSLIPVLHRHQVAVVPHLDAGRRSGHQPGVSQSRHHIRRVMEPVTRYTVHIPSLPIRPGQTRLRLSPAGSGKAHHAATIIRYVACCCERSVLFVFFTWYKR